MSSVISSRPGSLPVIIPTSSTSEQLGMMVTRLMVLLNDQQQDQIPRWIRNLVVPVQVDLIVVYGNQYPVKLAQFKLHQVEEGNWQISQSWGKFKMHMNPKLMRFVFNVMPN